MKVTVIGVAGGTGSGKSTLVKRLQEAFEGDDVVTLCHDYYYKACLLYTSPSPRDLRVSRMPSSA